MTEDPGRTPIDATSYYVKRAWTFSQSKSPRNNKTSRETEEADGWGGEGGGSQNGYRMAWTMSSSISEYASCLQASALQNCFVPVEINFFFCQFLFIIYFHPHE
jgi:hypothetical protein